MLFDRQEERPSHVGLEQGFDSDNRKAKSKIKICKQKKIKIKIIIKHFLESTLGNISIISANDTYIHSITVLLYPTMQIQV